MEVFDCHFHVEKGLTDYLHLPGRGNIIFNEVSSYQALAGLYGQYAHSLIFDYVNHLDLVAERISSKSIRALKIHSRLQHLTNDDYPELFRQLKRLNSGIPIIYDAFYFGHDFSVQPSMTRLTELAVSFPETKIIVAHAGGHHVLDYFFHLRSLKNIGYDLSFSLQYLEGTSAWADLEKLIKFTAPERLFWGSDFPFADPSKQRTTLEGLLGRLDFSSRQMEGVFLNNWMEFTEY